MFTHQNESVGRGGDGPAEQLRVLDTRIAVLAWTGLSLSFVVGVGIVAGHIALQWAIGAWTIAIVLAVREHYQRPATEDDVRAEEQWLQAVVDTWTVGRSI